MLPTTPALYSALGDDGREVVQDAAVVAGLDEGGECGGPDGGVSALSLDGGCEGQPEFSELPDVAGW